MLGILFLLILLLAPLFFVRWLRWLGIFQQKEYRLDRLFAFLKSDEGRAELMRIVPVRQDFTRQGMKRPHITPRVLVVAVLSLVIGVGVLGSFTFVMGQNVFSTSALTQWFIGIVVGYLCVPLFIILGGLPSNTVSAVVTFFTLQKASGILQKAQPKIIGIGGSYGKTSTKHLLHHFLSQKFSVFVTPRSFNTKFSVAKSICDGYKKQEIALLEYGAYIRGEIEYLASWFRPHMAVETGFTPQHLSLFGSRHNSLLAESELIAALPGDGVVFCNGADPGAIEICQIGALKSKAEIAMYAGPDSKTSLKKTQLNKHGQLGVSWKGHTIQTQLIGCQYLVNLQAAIAVSQYMGLSEKQIVSAAHSFQPNSSFIQGAVLKTGAYFINDGGTSNPKGFAAALEILEELPYQRKILITAGMIDLGKETHQIHHQIAKEAKRLNLTVCHVGVDGKAEFVELFGSVLIDEVADVQDVLNHTNKETVVLLEGKVSKILEQQLEHMTEQLI
jgi:UDP-N-acetylmuramoyl-tripeptide--D-alanyl-D-alanine ligase